MLMIHGIYMEYSRYIHKIGLPDEKSGISDCVRPGIKACILKPQTFVLWTPRKEHTESAIRKDYYDLAPESLQI